MNPGDTLIGLDEQGHLWMVLTSEGANGQVVVANLTTHDPEKYWCSERCVLVRPGEHPYPERDSCVFYRDAFLTSASVLRRGVDNRTYRMNEPLSAELLARVRQGALDSPLALADVQAAIRQDRQRR